MKRKRKNPTLVAHGLAKKAFWHVVTAAGKPIADLYVRSQKAAGQQAQQMANALGVQLKLLKNVRVGVPLKQHPTRRVRPKKKAAARPRAKKRKAKKNPASSSEMAQARETFRMWHDFEPEDVVRVRTASRTIPRVLVKLGEIPRHTYISDKWSGKRETYVHDNKKPYPVLCTGPDGRGLYIVGGRTRVTERGLVD